MYSYIKGTLEEINQDSITVECSNIGYRIFATNSAVKDVVIGQYVKIYIVQVVREDELSLYGFVSQEEKNMFLKLISVSGIGPKSALLMLSEIGASSVATAIVTGDAKSLTKISGVGMKTAQRLILELRGSIDNNEFISGDSLMHNSAVESDVTNEAITAIMALGFSRSEAIKSVSQVKKSGTVEDIIREVLRNMDKK